MLLNLGYKSQAATEHCKDFLWGLAWLRHAGTVAWMVFCQGTLLGWVTLRVLGIPTQTHPATAAAEQSPQNACLPPSLPCLFTSGLGSHAVLPFLQPAPSLAVGGGFQDEMRHLPGERCFGLQWCTLIKNKENLKKGLRDGPKQTAALWCPSDGGTVALHDARVIVALHQDDGCPRAGLRHRGWSGAQCDGAAF